MSTDVTVKCGVNTRAPLASRLPKKRTEDSNAGAPASSALHRSLETTYDIHYTPKRLEERGAGSSANPWSTQRANTNDLKVRDAMPSSDATAASPCREGALAGTHSGALGEGNNWQSTSHAASRCVQPTQRLDFYSTALKIEREDDEKRGGLVGSTQRAVDIRNKRALDEQMQPEVPEYTKAEKPQLPMVAAQERRLVRRNYLDLVECTHRNPKTEHQLGYEDTPESRLPADSLSQEIDVQSKAITHMGTTEDMFRGSAKYLDDKDVGYAGHVPKHDRNLAAIHHGEDARRKYSKSFMTLAVHNGGVDATVSSTNIKARHRTGRQAQATKILNPKSDEVISQTVEGRFLQQPMKETLSREKAINIRDDAQAERFF